MCLLGLKARLQLSQAPRMKLSPCLRVFPELLIGAGEGSRETESPSLPDGFDLPPGTTEVPLRAGTLLHRTIYLWTVLCWGHQEFTALNPILLVHLFPSMS